jgi:hypothetical protein
MPRLLHLSVTTSLLNTMAKAISSGSLIRSIPFSTPLIFLPMDSYFHCVDEYFLQVGGERAVVKSKVDRRDPIVKCMC